MLLEPLKFLEANAAALTVLFAGAVTVATVVYAVLTWRLVAETRLMRRVQTEPRIEITLDSLDIAINLVRLKFRNIGHGPALNLHISTRVLSGDQPAQGLLDDFTDLNYFKTGIAYFGPGETRFSSHTDMTEDHDGKISSIIAFDVEYRGAGGSKHKDSIVIDMNEFRGTYRVGKPHLYSIAQSLEGLQEEVRRITSGQKRIKIDFYSHVDRDREQQDLIRRHEEYKKRRGGDT